MKVLDLQCGQGHAFEGWFDSEGDYQGQLARGLLACPLCGDRAVVKLPSAPRLNLGAAAAGMPVTPPAKPGAAVGDDNAAVATLPPAALQAAWMHMVRRVLASTEDVGDRFAEEARKMHYGEADERGIRGQATREQTEELLDEGIAVVPLLLPAGLKGPLQ